MIAAVVQALQACVASSDWSIVVASVEATHAHLLLTYTRRNIDNTVKWLSYQTTKAIHHRTPHCGPVWCKGKWLSFIFEQNTWQNTKVDIERHNVRRGADPRPYAFLDL